MVGDPLLHVAQRVAVRDLRGELRAELRLIAGAAQEEHEPAGDGERDVATEVVLDQRECEVHARGDAGGRVDVAVAHEDRIRLDGDRRVELRQRVAHRPVRRRPAAVEQAGLGEDERTGAHRGHPRDRPARRRTPSSSARSRIASTVPSPPATISVSRLAAHAAESVVDAEHHAARRAHGRPARGHDLGRVGGAARLAIGGREHLDRADGVEALDARIHDDHDPAGGHGHIVRSIAVGGNEEFPTISAIRRRSAFRFGPRCDSLSLPRKGGGPTER